MRFVSGTEQTAIIPMYNINCETQKECLLQGMIWIFKYRVTSNLRRLIF